jgi:fatty-acyl-CoA synthase
LSSVRCVAYGGSPVLERVAKTWLARGIQVLQGYGMTEASPGVFMAVRHGSLERPVSVGVPHFFTDTALLTDDDRIISGPGQGELLVRGPNVFSRYWNRPAETPSMKAGSGAATSCASTRTAGPTSPAGSRT